MDLSPTERALLSRLARENLKKRWAKPGAREKQAALFREQLKHMDFEARNRKRWPHKYGPDGERLKK